MKKTIVDNQENGCASADHDTLVKWYCTERLVKSFRNLPTSISVQVSRNLSMLSSLFFKRGIRIQGIDFTSRSCGYTVDGVFFVTEW